MFTRNNCLVGKNAAHGTSSRCAQCVHGTNLGLSFFDTVSFPLWFSCSGELYMELSSSQSVRSSSTPLLRCSKFHLSARADEKRTGKRPMRGLVLLLLVGGDSGNDYFKYCLLSVCSHRSAVSASGWNDEGQRSMVVVRPRVLEHSLLEVVHREGSVRATCPDRLAPKFKLYRT
ncbi:hypothetical protein CBL_11526 [Carabus blaptoides fortunei]